MLTGVLEGNGMTTEEMKEFVLSDTPSNIARKFPHNFLVIMHYDFTGERIDYNTATVKIVERMVDRAKLMEDNPNRVDRQLAKEIYDEIEVGLSKAKEDLQSHVANPDFVVDREKALEDFLERVKGLREWIEGSHKESLVNKAINLFAPEEEEPENKENKEEEPELEGDGE